jgi:hypothetical protein
MISMELAQLLQLGMKHFQWLAFCGALCLFKTSTSISSFKKTQNQQHFKLKIERERHAAPCVR